MAEPAECVEPDHNSSTATKTAAVMSAPMRAPFHFPTAPGRYLRYHILFHSFLISGVLAGEQSWRESARKQISS